MTIHLRARCRRYVLSHPVRSVGGVPGWRPWRVLRSRTHLRLQYAFLHPSRGRIVDHGNGLRTITLDRRLDQAGRNDTLSHELVHDELNLLYRPDTPTELIEKCEHLVERISDERQLPVTELQAWVDRRGGPIHRWEVAEQFEVTEEVAERQMRRCAWGF